MATLAIEMSNGPSGMARFGNSHHNAARKRGNTFSPRPRAGLRWQFALIVGATLAAVGSLGFAAPAAAQDQAPTGLQMAAAMEQVLIEAIASAEKSVVAVARVRAEDETAAINRDPFGVFPPRRGPLDPTNPDFIPNEYGTGVVIDRQGLILTHYEVVRDGDTHWVTTADRQVYKAKIKAADPRSSLAVLSIEASGLAAMRFGDAAKLRKGQIVLALGNPYAIARDGQVSASWGIVSNFGRKVGPEPDGTKPTLHHSGTLIQTDAKLNLGTSGGALVNLRGEMVGMTTALAATAGYEMSAGYAIPIDEGFLRIINILKEGREVEYGFLGIGTDNLPPDQPGMLVSRVLEGTPAHRAGLEMYDVITHVDGKPVDDADALLLSVGKLPAGSPARLTVRARRGGVRQVEVELAKYPVQGHTVATNRPTRWRGMTVEYSTAIDGFETQAQIGNVDLGGCVAVASVDQDSPAWSVGLRPKMFISHVEGDRVAKPQAFYAAIANQAGPVRVRLTTAEDPERIIPP